MRVFSISVVKDEADVIKASLTDALRWSAKIFVLDNGSTDGTWEIVQALSEADERIVAWKRLDVPFQNGLRGHVYNAFKHHAEPGDWWCIRLDSDEFCIGDPRPTLEQVPRYHHVVCKDSIEYRLTEEDVQEHHFTGRFEEDRDKIRYYLPRTWREVRFMRHRAGLKWSEDKPFPDHMGVISDRVVPVKHYKYRNPEQLARRAQARQTTIDRSRRTYGAAHPGIAKWAELPLSEMNDHGQLFKRRDLLFDAGTDHPPTHGTSQPHRNKWYVRWLMLFMHGIGAWP